MRLIECEQQSDEWFAARVGVITASMFAECVKKLKSGKSKGEHTAKAKEYAFRLAVERISGEMLAEEGFETYAMRRGREMEAEARMAHELHSGLTVDDASFVLTDDRLFGASADGFIGTDGLSEYKCFIAPSSLMPILLDNDLSSVVDQVQGQLMVTERSWTDFVLYCPALSGVNKDVTVVRVERDEEYIEELRAGLLEFNGLVEEYKTTLANN